MPILMLHSCNKINYRKKLQELNSHLDTSESGSADLGPKYIISKCKSQDHEIYVTAFFVGTDVCFAFFRIP